MAIMTTKKISRLETIRPGATGSSSNALLSLPTELIILIIHYLGKVDKLMLLWTCSRLNSIICYNPAWHDIKARSGFIWYERQDIQRRYWTSRFLILEEEIQLQGKKDVALCWRCKKTHSRECFFTEQLKESIFKRSCKKAGYFASGWEYIPWATLQQTVLQAERRIYYTGVGRTEYVSTDKNYCLEGNGKSSMDLGFHGSSIGRINNKFRKLKKASQTQEYAAEYLFYYCSMYQDRWMMTDNKMRLKMAEYKALPICVHVTSNSEEVLSLTRSLRERSQQLSTKLKPRQSYLSDEGECKECCCRFWLRYDCLTWDNAGHEKNHNLVQLALLIEKQLGSMQEDDQLSNPMWLKHAENRPTSSLRPFQQQCHFHRYGKVRW